MPGDVATIYTPQKCAFCEEDGVYQLVVDAGWFWLCPEHHDPIEFDLRKQNADLRAALAAAEASQRALREIVDAALAWHTASEHHAMVREQFRTKMDPFQMKDSAAMRENTALSDLGAAVRHYERDRLLATAAPPQADDEAPS